MNAAALCRPRRLGDAVSEINADVHDAARLLVAAVDVLDRLGIPVVTVQADRRRNQRVIVEHCQACDQLGGVEVMRCPDFTLWTANRFGIEIRWMRTGKAVPA
jgi:hypothetical protein